ncbi:MAG: histidine phosphatase family protein [Armatimonadetes bacterium]|nr:histidine phosphatase family protein [Armatimonadota bacterium]
MTGFPRNIPKMEQDKDRTTLILVRHGETEWNLAGRIQGHSDSRLTARGAEQGRRAAERLAGLDISTVYASDLGRARETGEIIAAPHGLAVTTVQGLRERCYGAFEGRTAEEIRTDDPGAFERWLGDRQGLAPPGGETQQELSERVMGALRGIAGAHPGETVAIATHGGPIKSAVFAVLEIPMGSWDRTWVSNGSVTVLRGNQCELKVACFNDTSHLDSVVAQGQGVED